MSADHADDEKTIREEPEHDFSDKKDIEAAKDGSLSRAGSVTIQPPEADADLDDDDFPDGGLRAWSVVIGVCGPLCRDSCFRLTLSRSPRLAPLQRSGS